MTPDELKGWADQLGTPLIAVILLIMVVIPLIRRTMKEGQEAPAAMQVEIALIKAKIDDMLVRLKILEDKPRR